LLGIENPAVVNYLSNNVWLLTNKPDFEGAKLQKKYGNGKGRN
jgi:hypothetical protein